MRKLAIVTTHPIQYNDPLFALLSKRKIIHVKVFYTWGQKVMQEKYDPGFGLQVQWDIELLKDYEYTFVENRSSHPGSHHFKGIDNPTLIHEISQWQADVVLVYGWAFKSHLKVLRYFHKKKLVLFRGDSINTEVNVTLTSVIKKVWLKWVYSHVDTALYVGTLNKKYFIQYGLKQNQLVFAPHAVDNNRFMKNEIVDRKKAVSKREQLGIDTGQTVFLYAGKLDKNKNVEILLNAYKNIHNNESHLIIAGSGITEESLKKIVPPGINVHFLPFQNQAAMPVLYRMSDVFILPSLSETWGLGINEAMLCGCALLITKRAGASVDLVHEGINGFTFDPENEYDLQNKLSMMMLNKTMVTQLGSCSLNIIQKWNYIADCEAIENLVCGTY